MCRGITALLPVLALLISSILIGCGPTEGTAEWYIEQGNRFYNEGKYHNAVESYDEAIRLNPGDAEAYNNRGVTYEYLNQFEQAIKDYDEAIRLTPWDAEPYYMRGLVNKEQGKKADAIADFEKFIIFTHNPELIGIAQQQKHRALADAITLEKVFINFLGHFKDRGVINLGQLIELQGGPIGVPVFNTNNSN